MSETEADWIKRAQRTSKKHRSLIDLNRRSAALCLVELHELMRTQVSQLLDSYARIDEALLFRNGIESLEIIDSGSLGWVTAGDSRDEWIGAIAAQIRGLDAWLHGDIAQRKGRPGEALIEEGGWYIIPRFPYAEYKWPAKTGDTYLRRGLRYHRFVPQVNAGYRVKLFDSPHFPLPIEGTRCNCSAAFPAISDSNFKTKTSEDGFVVEEVAIQSDELNDHLRYASRESSDLHTWPELTIDGVRKNEVSKIIRNWPLDIDRLPEVIVAGSLHDIDAGNRKNRATVFFDGEKHFFHDKFFPFEDRTLGYEDIKNGESISILIYKGILITFAICLDYCNFKGANPYKGLGADLVVVPSMGRITTIESHRMSAVPLWINEGQRVFVVQQADPGWLPAWEEAHNKGGDTNAPPPRNYVIPPAALKSDTPISAYEAKESVYLHRWG